MKSKRRDRFETTKREVKKERTFEYTFDDRKRLTKVASADKEII